MLGLQLETERLILFSFSRELLIHLIESQKSNYYSWFGNEEVTKYNSHGLFPQSKKELNEYFDKCENSKDLLVFMIIEKETNQHIGMISLQKIDWINRSAEFAVLIGETDRYGKGYCTEAAKKLFDHAFLKLNLRRIYAGTAKTNVGMIKVFEKLGMKQEGEKKEAMFLNGKYEDIVEYSILRS